MEQTAEAKRLKYNAYHREYRKKNPQKWAEINARYYAKKAEKLAAQLAADADKEA